MSLEIPCDAAFGATYEVRLFSNGTRVATSNSFTVQPTTLTVVTDSVIAGGTVTVAWAYVLSPRSGDWIGFYSSSQASDDAYLASQPMNGLASGFMTFEVPADTPAGTTYEMRLFNRNGGRLATSDSFTIRVPALSVSPTRVRRGGTVIATWANIAWPSTDDWIGVYSSSAASDTSYVAYSYATAETNGAAGIVIPPTAPTGATYELRLFRNNGSTNTRLVTSTTFRVEAASLRVSPTTVIPSQLVLMTWAGVPTPTTKDWMGLYPSSSAPNSPALSWTYIPPMQSGTLPFTIPAGTVPGTTYELRLFSNDGYSRLATSNTFTVRAP
jgi:hypothetical protein